MKQEDKAERLVQGQFDVLISKLSNAWMIAQERIPTVDVDSIREAIAVLSALNRAQPAAAIPEGYALVNAGALQMVVNALRRDAAEGKVVRGEMADELIAAAPQQKGGA